MSPRKLYIIKVVCSLSLLLALGGLIRLRTVSAQTGVIWAYQQGTSVNATSGVKYDPLVTPYNYFGLAKTTQTISGPGYFEFTYQNSGSFVGLGPASGVAANTGYNDLRVALELGPNSTVRSASCNATTLYCGEINGLTAGQVYRIEIETGTGDFLIKLSGSSTILARVPDNGTRPYPYHFYFKSQDEPPQPRSIGNTTVFGGSSGGGGGSIITDRNLALAIPAPPSLAGVPKGGKFIDLTFGTEVMRVTTEADGNDNQNAYAIWSSFNFNSTRILLREGDIYATNVSGETITGVIRNFNPTTFTLDTGTPIPFPSSLPGGGSPRFEGATWSRDNADLIHFSDQFRVVTYNVSTGTVAFAKDLRCLAGQTQNCLRANETFDRISVSTDNDNVFAGNVMDGDRIGFLVYNKVTDTILVRRWTETGEAYHVGRGVQVNNSGNYLIVGHATGAPNVPEMRSYKIDLSQCTAASCPKIYPEHGDPGHSDLSTTHLVGYTSCSAPKCDEVLNDSLSKWDLTSTAATMPSSLILQLKSEYGETHFSMRGNDTNWVLMSITGGKDFDCPMSQHSTSNPALPPYCEPIRSELVLVNINNLDNVRRLVHTHAKFLPDTDPAALAGQNYWISPKANISRDGQFAIFNSNWGNTTYQRLYDHDNDPGTAPITLKGREDVFIVKIPPASGTTAPAAPTNLTATAASATQINLNWLDNSNNETGFIIERCTGAGCSNFALVTTTAANATTYNDGGRASGTTYTYRVRATNAGVDSANTLSASATTPSAPATPTGLTATSVSSSQINLSWSNVTSETGYEVDRCTGAGCSNYTLLTSKDWLEN